VKQDENERPTLNLLDVRRRADAAAASFDSADFVPAVTREGLLERLRPLVIEPERIIDLGCATGTAGSHLRKRFRGAHVIALDLSENMLRHARRKRGWLSRSGTSFVQAEAAHLPIRDHSIDLVFSNLLLPFADRHERIFSEAARVLRKGGVFAFATLGPDSLQEIRRAWSQIDGHVHVNRFPDMHDIGDALVRAGLGDPVLDVDRLAVEYEDPARLFVDLGNVGARNTLAARRRSLLGKRRFSLMQEALAGTSTDGKIRLNLELVYGHCWSAGPRPKPGTYAIDAARIPRRRS